MTRTGAFTATTLVVLAASLLASPTAQAAPGDLDPTFSGDGRELTNFGVSDYGQGVAIQADGKLVVVGGSYAGAGRSHDFALARYNPDGSLDPTFSGGGTQTTDFFGSSDAAYGVAIQPDGKILVVGHADGNFGVARYLPDGSLDTSLDGDGKQTTDFGGGSNAAYGVAIQPDGKIVAVGHAPGSDGEWDFALARYDADGSLDSSFDGDGRQTTDLEPTTDFGLGAAYAVALQPDGKIVAVGRAGGNLGLARYNPDGSLDATFSGDGKQTTDLGGDDEASDVALQPDGKIVAVGSSYVFQAGSTSFVVARYNPDGSLDRSFGNPILGGGLQLTGFGGTDRAHGVAIDADGKIVAVGDGSGDFALARYNTDGSHDATFSDDGTQTTDFGGSDGAYDAAYDVALQPDGKIVAVGASTGGFALARYQGGSGPDAEPPETAITDGPAGTTNDSTPAFGFDSSEAGSTFECRVDGGAFSPCGSPHTTSTLSDGSHTFEVRAIDAAGNPDPSPANRDFTVDTTAPETTITGGPTGTTSAATSTFTFGSSEAGSTFECRVDGGAFSPCSSPHTTPALSDGSHSFEVRGTDGAGNTDPTPASRSWTVVPDYRSVVLATPGLVSYWRLAETSGTIAADAKGANKGRYRNGVVLGGPGALLYDANPAVGFDGSNDYVDVPDHASLDTGDRFTLEAWVKRSSTSSSTKTVLAKGGGSWRLSFTNNVLTLAKGGSGTVASASVSTTDTTGFHHVMATKSGGSARLYIDGVDRTGTVTNRTIANTSAALNIGRYTSGSEHFPGLIDEVAIYNLALGAAQVQQHFKASGR
jgi:uncharacterized delta-60 repeat protein